MTSPVGLEKIESNTTNLSPTTEDCGNKNNQDNNNSGNVNMMCDDIAISPIEGYSEVKEISSPYSKLAHVGSSSGESTPTANGSTENLMLTTNSSVIKTTSLSSINTTIIPSTTTTTTTTATAVLPVSSVGVINSPSSIIANRNFCNMSGLNDIPQWKKDLIARKKSNIAKTSEIKQQSETMTSSTSSKTETEQNPSFLLKKLSPISSKSKSINPSTVKLSKSEVKSPVTLSSSSSCTNLNSNQSISSNKIISCITSSTKDVAIDDNDDDINRKSSIKINQSPTKVLLSGSINNNNNNKNNINSSQEEFNIIIKEGAKKLNKSSLATSTSATNELLLTNKDGSTADNNISSCNRNQMPVKFNNVNSVANKYKENLILNLSITPLSSSSSSSSSSSTITTTTLLPSTSVVKSIIGEITSKGQYTNSSNKMIDSPNTIIKSEILNYNMAAATIPTTTATTSSTTMELQQQQKSKHGKIISNRIGIQIPQQNKNDIDEKITEINIESCVSNNITLTTNAPPIPMRRTSLNQQHKIEQHQQQLKQYMATSLQIKSDNILNMNIENSMEVDLQQHINTLMEQRQQQQHNSDTKETEDENETEQKNLLLTNQLHSRHESNKFGIELREIDEYALNNKNNKLLKTSITGNNSNCSNSLTKENNKNESINSVIKINDGDGSNIGNIDAFINSENSQNLINNKIKNNLIKDSDDKIDNVVVNEDKTYGHVSLLNADVKKSLPQSLQLSASTISSNSFKQPQQSYHHQGYIKNSTVNKNSTATINKYIAAAAAKNQNTTLINNSNKILQKNSSPSTSPFSSPKKNLLNSCAVTTTAATTKLLTITTVTDTTSSLPSSSSTLILSSPPSLLSNYKQQQKKNIIQNLDSSNNKMVAVPEIQLKSTNSSLKATTATNGESSNIAGDPSVTTTINNTKTTAKINNSNNNLKRTKMINNIKNTKNEDDEFNDFDPSEELKYGPGIVSKLRCRYLSLALRQSTGKQRLPLDNLRRATSLNNLLDGGSGTNVVNKVNGACGTTNKSTNIQNNNDNSVIDEDDNDYEHLIINSNHNHYINNKNRNQKLLNQQQQNGLSNNLKEIKEQDIVRTITENSCSSSSSASNTTTTAADINAGSLLLTTNDNVEKPDHQQQQNEQQKQKNSFICKNIQQTSADGAISTAIGKTSVSAIIAEKNLLNKTGCNTNFDQYQYYQQQQQKHCNNQQSNQYIRNTAAAVAAGIIRSGRQVKRGNDSIKRARSVEALLCEKPDIWSGNTDINADIDNAILNDIDESKDNKNGGIKDNNTIMSNSAHAALHWNNNSNNANNINCNSPTNSNGSPILTEVTIEDKIINAREQRKHEKHPPKRLTSVIDDTERPPPDVVKQTLKIFEASANRRGGRGISKNHQSGHVAMKVANYKSIISQDQKPPISYPKPPLSPKRLGTLNNVTVTNGVKSKPNTLNIQNGINSNTNNNNNNNKKFNKNSPKVSSPVSSLTKRFNSQSSEESTINENINKSSVPLSGIASPTTLNHAAYLRNRNESTPIRTIQQIRAPDIIPRKLFDNNLVISPVIDATNSEIHSSYNNTSTTDSPVTQLTKRMDRLKIETPSPTLLNSNSSTLSSQGATASTPTIKGYNLNNKSSESETDCDDEIYSYDVTAVDDDADDDDDDDDSIDGDNEIIVKKISKTALENISKAGSSQCFSFKNVKTTPLIGVSPTTSAEQITLPAPKQVGIIRPLVAEPKIITNISPEIKSDIISINNSQTDKLKLTSICDNNADNSIKIQSPIIQENLTPPQPTKRSLFGLEHDHIVAGASNNEDNTLVITNLSQNQIKSEKLTAPVSNSNSNNKNNSTNNIESNTLLDNNIVKPALTSREIEKNLINEKKNELANLESSGNSSILGATTATNTSNSNNNNELNNWQQQLIQKKKNSNNSSAPIEAQNNIMVFNFKDRKEVPDYIENDGLFIKRKRELPKPNESGFVLLGDLSLETSTDPDDSWTMGPPSPCNVEFENANIIIDGKSSLRFRSRDGSLRVQFDDTLTSTFEYPSESSLLDEFALTTPNDSFYATNSNQNDKIDNKSQHNIEVEELIPVQMLSSSTSSASPATTITTPPLSTHVKSLGNMPIDYQKIQEDNITPIKITTAIISAPSAITSDAIISTVKIIRPLEPPPPVPPTRIKILKIAPDKPLSVITTTITATTTTSTTTNFYQLQSPKSLTLPLPNTNLLKKNKITINSKFLASSITTQPISPPPIPLNKPINIKPLLLSSQSLSNKTKIQTNVQPLISSSSYKNIQPNVKPLIPPISSSSSSLNKSNKLTNIKPFSLLSSQSSLVTTINTTTKNDYSSKFKLNTAINSINSTQPPTTITTTTSVKSRILQFQKLETESAKSRNILLKTETPKTKSSSKINDNGFLKIQKTAVASSLATTSAIDDKNKNYSNSLLFNSLISIGTESIV